MKNLLLTLLATSIALSCLCQCQSDQPQSASVSPKSSIFEDCMMNDVRSNKPWTPRAPTNQSSQEAHTGGGLLIVSEDDAFHKDTDDPWKLLAQAREGNDRAMAKMQDYVTQESNRDPSICFELDRMFALRRGIDGVAKYYGENKGNWRASKDRRAIEQTIRQMESEALKGNWVYAVALYQFLGSLNETDGRLPWGGNEELSAKWLEIIYKSAGKQAFDAVIKDESARMGQSRDLVLYAPFFPHTPKGWKPSN